MSIINISGINISLNSLKKILILIIIATFSLIAREYKISFSYGVNFGMSSLFIFILLRYYGVITASSVLMIINILDWYFFNGDIYNIILFFEVIFVGGVWKNRQRDLFLLDVFYWVVIGAPASLLIYYLNRNSIDVESLLLVMNLSIKGILNVLVADIVLSFAPVKRVFEDNDNYHVDLSKMIFHITIAAVLGPFLVFTMVDGWFSKDKFDNEIYEKLNSTSISFADKLSTWSIDEMRKLRLRSPIYIKKFRDIVNNNPTKDFVEVLLVDKNKKLYLKNTEIKYNEIYDWKAGGEYTEVYKNVYKWYPKYKGIPRDLGRWREAFYIMIVPFDNMDVELEIKVPLSSYAESMWQTYLNKFTILLFFCIVAAIISKHASRLVSKDLLKLTESTTGLIDKLKRQQVIEWPDTSIRQINFLVSNFKVMSDNLVNLFYESRIMNNQLLSQTKELEASKEQLRIMAYNDALTGLPNRRSFNRYLEELLASAKDMSIAVIFIDLNRFKQINDTLGHEAGDVLIQEVGKRFSSLLKDNYFVARLGGDEFVIVLSNADKKMAAETANQINEFLSETIFIHQNDQTYELYISGCIGISMYPNDTYDKSTLLKYADLAMYAAKETGDNTFRFYSEIAESNMSEQLQLEQSLCKALERNEIVIYYQPKVNVLEKTITGVEALIRWKHPQRGIVLPSQFIPLAEETGIINHIGEWVLIEACKQNKEWQKKGYPKLRISVNLSIRQFFGNNVIRMVTKALEISGLEPKYLELEITEGVLMKNVEYIISVLEELRNMGVYISIDDFGTGYSSFCRLKELPIQFLKIDKSFVTDISKEKTNSSIVAAIIQLAHSMKLKVIAEGVETFEEYELLEMLDCDEIQGYLFSKPLINSEFEELIKNFEFPVHVSSYLLKGDL